MATSFSGGEKLQAHLKKLAEKVSNPGTLRVGFLESATYPDGTPVAMVAAIQNFGAPNAGIPARPFFSSMIDRQSPEWGEKLARVLEHAGWDGNLALKRMGVGIEGQLRESVVDTLNPPLSAVTVLLRKMKADNPDLEITKSVVGQAARMVRDLDHPVMADAVSDKPLVDTGHMLASVASEVTR